MAPSPWLSFQVVFIPPPLSTIGLVQVIGFPKLPKPSVRAPWKRNERSVLAGVKTTSYAENVMMREYAQQHGGDEALMSAAA